LYSHQDQAYDTDKPKTTFVNSSEVKKSGSVDLLNITLNKRLLTFGSYRKAGLHKKRRNLIHEITPLTSYK